MFDFVPPPVAAPTWLRDGGLGSEVGGPPSDEALERLLAEAETVLGDVPPWVPDRVPEWLDGAAEPGSPWAPGQVEEPAPAYGACSPSGRLALELDRGTADAAGLSDESLIEAIVGFDRVGSWAAARQARLLAELVRRRPPDPVPDADGVSVGSRFAPDEVGVALKLARGTAAGRIGTACRLLSVLPGTHRLWEDGLIDTAKARAVDEATAVLSDELAAAVEARVLPRAPQQSLARLRSALARAVIAVDPHGAAERHRAARKDRRVHVQQESDGMASLWALLTATDAAGAYAWLTRLARGLGPDDPRTMDTRRADLLAELLNGRLPASVMPAAGSDADDTATAPSSGRPGGAGKPLVQIVMAHSTLVGADDQPAELVGFGSIPADLAREVAADGVWRRLVTDPLSGALLDHGRGTYHPPAALGDFVRARDQHCRFPHCRRRAGDAELDHVVAWTDGGHTSAANLRAFCPHHHRLKHHAGWRVEAHPDGRLTWTTPTGHRHTTEPHDYGGSPAPPPAPGPAAADEPDPPPF